MFVDELRRAAEAAPRERLPEVARVLWKALASSQIGEEGAEAAALQALGEVVGHLAPRPEDRRARRLP